MYACALLVELLCSKDHWVFSKIQWNSRSNHQDSLDMLELLRTMLRIWDHTAEFWILSQYGSLVTKSNIGKHSWQYWFVIIHIIRMHAYKISENTSKRSYISKVVLIKR